MLSRENMALLEAQGYQYIVGARLANSSPSFIDLISDKLTREDGAMIRLAYPDRSYEIIGTYSEQRYKKDKREMDKQIEKAKTLIAHKEPGKCAKFVKKSPENKTTLLFDEALKIKTEKLLGIKGYCTNISQNVLSNEQVVTYYHELWRIEQAFRMSKTDLKTRPIFHYLHDAVKAHVLLCFM